MAMISKALSKALGKNYNLTAKQERMFLGAVILAIVVVYGYMAPQCWFYPWGYGPEVCQLKCGGFSSGGGTSGGGSSGGGTCGVCDDGSPCDCPEQSCETCTPPEGQSPCGMGNDYMCGGYCPYLYTCEFIGYPTPPTIVDPGYTGGASCACVPDYPASDDRGDDNGDGSSPCYWGVTTMMCGGSCTNGETCAAFVTANQDYVCGCRSDSRSWVDYPYTSVL